MHLKSILSFCTVLYLLLLGSCNKQMINQGSSDYKGDALHAPVPISIFPSEDIYNLSSLSDTLLSKELDDNIINAMTELDLTGVTMTMIIPDKGIWQLDSGYISIVDNVLVDSTSVFYWASVSKLITSTIVHQLIAEQKLDSTDKLSKWFPQFKNSEEITITHLLNHTSGIYSFNNDSTFHFSNLFYTPSELLDISLSESNLFGPGEYWSYSNTGYLLLALISESIEAKSFFEIVDERISLPQDILSLRALKPNEQPVNLAQAHDQGIVVESHYSLPLGAGNIVGNSKDMAMFYYALLTGEYLPVETVHNMLDELYPGFEIGQYFGSGIMLIDFNEINETQNQWIGHSGGTENYKAMLVYDVEKKIICAISANENAPIEAIVYRMISLVPK